MEDKSFHLKGSVAAYKIKYTNQVTSNNGEIDLNIREKLLILSQFLASVTLTISRSLTT